MALMKSFQNRQKSKIIIKFLIFLTFISFLVIASGISFSRIIGDYYYNNGNNTNALFWYRLNYDVFRSDESLKDMCITASLVNDTKTIIAYTPELVQKNILSNDELLEFTVTYINALYINGNFDEFRRFYHKSIYDFVGNNDITQPLSLIAMDESASQLDLMFAIEMGDLILELNDQKDIFKLPVYYSQAQAYQKLGNLFKYQQYLRLYEDVKQKLLNDK